MCEVQTASLGTTPSFDVTTILSLGAASLSLFGIVTQTHVKCRHRCQNSQNNYVCKLAGTRKTFDFVGFPFAFLVLGPKIRGEKVFVFVGRRGFISVGICFAFLSVSSVCLCLYTLAIEAIRRLGTYSS